MLSVLEQQLQQSADDLVDLGARFALVGGLAVGTRVEPRFTRDIDLAVAVDIDSQAEDLAFHLRQRNYRLMAEVDQVARSRLGTLRFAAPSGVGQKARPIILDLLFASCGIEQEVVQAATSELVTPNLSLPVARIEHLIAMKTLSAGPARPMDAADLLQLIRAATPEQIARARDLLTLITQRGFHRRRNLSRHLDSHLKRATRAR
jgi:hypothetical protein